jgi:hypothetical protein
MMVSSFLHTVAKFDLDNLNFEKWFDTLQVYSCSKLANILTANELSRKLKGTGESFAEDIKIFCRANMHLLSCSSPRCNASLFKRSDKLNEPAL